VPCAPSWVDTSMSRKEVEGEMGGAAGGSLVRVVWLKENGAAAPVRRTALNHHDPVNDGWSLAELWNGPLYRQMRREMAPGGSSHRCRASCRVILGVEERGTRFFTIPDGELDPRVARNRSRLLDEIRNGKSVLESTPLELTVGVSAHCNFTCGFCTGPQGQFGELSERRLGDVMEYLPGLMQLSVVGPGEPLMSVTFKRLLSHIAEHGYPSLCVSLTTNGTLARPSWVKQHENIHWGQIRFSINAGSAATHERMTGKQLFGQLLENIDAVVELRERKSPPFTFVLSCVLSEFILGDLHRYAELVDRCGALPVLEPMTGDMNGLSPYINEDRTRRLMEECQSVARAYEHRNPQLYHAFEAMGRFAEERLRLGLFNALPAK
jgi:pyruvate-formate lyase-activating enzyme